MSTQVRTWTEHCGAEGEPSRWDLSINDRPVPGGYIEKTAEGFEIHYPHLPLKKLTTLEEAKRSLELAPPISTAGLKVGRIADEDSDLISSAEAGEILGVSRFRVNAMVASGVLPGRRDNGKILVDRAAAEQKAAKIPGISGSSPTFSCSTRQQANARNMWLNSKPTTPTPSNAPAPSPKKSWRTKAKTP
ncbi:MAG: helix-turn-helix domain-containing protein [Adlercreutzia sp.]